MGTAFPDYMQPMERRKRESSDKLRVGFISSYWRHHSIFKTHGAFVTQLSRIVLRFTRFILVLSADVATEQIKEAVAHFHHWPDFGLTHVERLRELNLDVLIYPDYGMEPRLQMVAPSKACTGSVQYGWSPGHIGPSTHGLFFKQ